MVSFYYPEIVASTVKFLASDCGEQVVPRVITGLVSSLFIAAYITEIRRKRELPLLPNLLSCFTTLSLSVGFYTLSRWLILDIYGSSTEKFMPYISKLDITALVVALIMLLIEVSKQLAHEISKLKRSTKGITVEAA
ncbi:hypothetical protein AR688_08100 [Rheinheimera sp. EpRS3]|nr:hypothetical protein AR688_08100 [Rheinheimera sp. EpRS3]